ncbi:MAG: hypothetical protein WCX95_04400, partial [Candidatus Gracilibacteria bacterium]
EHDERIRITREIEEKASTPKLLKLISVAANQGLIDEMGPEVIKKVAAILTLDGKNYVNNVRRENKENLTENKIRRTRESFGLSDSEKAQKAYDMYVRSMEILYTKQLEIQNMFSADLDIRSMTKEDIHKILDIFDFMVKNKGKRLIEGYTEEFQTLNYNTPYDASAAQLQNILGSPEEDTGVNAVSEEQLERGGGIQSNEKFGVRVMTKDQAKELARMGIKVKAETKVQRTEAEKLKRTEEILAKVANRRDKGKGPDVAKPAPATTKGKKGAPLTEEEKSIEVQEILRNDLDQSKNELNLSPDVSLKDDDYFASLLRDGVNITDDDTFMALSNIEFTSDYVARTKPSSTFSEFKLSMQQFLGDVWDRVKQWASYLWNRIKFMRGTYEPVSTTFTNMAIKEGALRIPARLYDNNYKLLEFLRDRARELARSEYLNYKRTGNILDKRSADKYRMISSFNMVNDSHNQSMFNHAFETMVPLMWPSVPKAKLNQLKSIAISQSFFDLASVDQNMMLVVGKLKDDGTVTDRLTKDEEAKMKHFSPYMLSEKNDVLYERAQRYLRNALSTMNPAVRAVIDLGNNWKLVNDNNKVRYTARKVTPGLKEVFEADMSAFSGHPIDLDVVFNNPKAYDDKVVKAEAMNHVWNPNAKPIPVRNVYIAGYEFTFGMIDGEWYLRFYNIPEMFTPGNVDSMQAADKIDAGTMEGVTTEDTNMWAMHGSPNKNNRGIIKKFSKDMWMTGAGDMWQGPGFYFSVENDETVPEYYANMSLSRDDSIDIDRVSKKNKERIDEHGAEWTREMVANDLLKEFDVKWYNKHDVTAFLDQEGDIVVYYDGLRIPIYELTDDQIGDLKIKAGMEEAWKHGGFDYRRNTKQYDKERNKYLREEVAKELPSKFDNGTPYGHIYEVDIKDDLKYIDFDNQKVTKVEILKLSKEFAKAARLLKAFPERFENKYGKKFPSYLLTDLSKMFERIYNHGNDLNVTTQDSPFNPTSKNTVGEHLIDKMFTPNDKKRFSKIPLLWKEILDKNKLLDKLIGDSEGRWNELNFIWNRILQDLGYGGVKYTSSYGNKNIVVFNENNITIKDAMPLKLLSTENTNMQIGLSGFQHYLQTLPPATRKLALMHYNAAKDYAKEHNVDFHNKGASERMRQQYGWYINPEGRMRFEISDSRLELYVGNQNNGKLPTIANVDHVSAIYKEAKDVDVIFEDKDNLNFLLPGQRGKFIEGLNGRPAKIILRKGMDGDQTLRTLGHEIQHFVQSQEGSRFFDVTLDMVVAHGNNLIDMYNRDLNAMSKDPAKYTYEISETTRKKAVVQRIMRERSGMISARIKKLIMHDMYMMVVTEVEARLTSGRMSYTSEQLRNIPFDYDVPLRDVLTIEKTEDITITKRYLEKRLPAATIETIGPNKDQFKITFPSGWGFYLVNTEIESTFNREGKRTGAIYGRWGLRDSFGLMQIADLEKLVITGEQVANRTDVRLEHEILHMVTDIFMTQEEQSMLINAFKEGNEDARATWERVAYEYEKYVKDRGSYVDASSSDRAIERKNLLETIRENVKQLIFWLKDLIIPTDTKKYKTPDALFEAIRNGEITMRKPNLNLTSMEGKFALQRLRHNSIPAIVKVNGVKTIDDPARTA